MAQPARLAPQTFWENLRLFLLFSTTFADIRFKVKQSKFYSVINGHVALTQYLQLITILNITYWLFFHLSIVDDSEMYEIQKPFRLDELNRISAFLNNVVFKMLWNEMVEGMFMFLNSRWMSFLFFQYPSLYLKPFLEWTYTVAFFSVIESELSL